MDYRLLLKFLRTEVSPERKVETLAGGTNSRLASYLTPFIKALIEEPPESVEELLERDGVSEDALAYLMGQLPLVNLAAELESTPVGSPGLVIPQPLEDDGGEEEPTFDEGIPLINKNHYYANVKLVYWIPYRRNKLPLLRRFLPKQWRDTDPELLPGDYRLAARAMLATGNPRPPQSFPTRKSWDDFLASKEYRGALSTDLYICCPDDKPRHAIGHPKVGYTPPASNVKRAPKKTFAKRLKADHGNHQNVGSLAEMMVHSYPGEDILNALKLSWPLVSSQYKDAISLIKKLGKSSNKAYSEGELHFAEKAGEECLSGTMEFGVRVAKIHNLLNFATTSTLIGFQGGDLSYKLCCADGTLTLDYRHSVIPSQALYVNNQLVWTYDMLEANWMDVEECFYGPESSLLKWSVEELEAALKKKVFAPKSFKMPTKKLRLEQRAGCTGIVPDDQWLYDRGI